MDFYILPQLRLATASRPSIKLGLNRSLVWMSSLPMPSFSYLNYCNNCLQLAVKFCLSDLPVCHSADAAQVTYGLHKI